MIILVILLSQCFIWRLFYNLCIVGMKLHRFVKSFNHLREQKGMRSRLIRQNTKFLPFDWFHIFDALISSSFLFPCSLILLCASDYYLSFYQNFLQMHLHHHIELPYFFCFYFPFDSVGVLGIFRKRRCLFRFRRTIFLFDGVIKTLF